MKILVSLRLLFAVASLCHASDTRTLTGITAVNVVVEDLSPGGASRLGLKEESLQTDVELKLRLAGMRVVKELRLPMFFVNVSVSADTLVSRVSVQLLEMAKLVRDPATSVIALIWTSQTLTQNGNALQIPGVVKDKVDEFLNDRLTVNASPRRN